MRKWHKPRLKGCRFACRPDRYAEQVAEDQLRRRDDLRFERKLDKKQQKERLEELMPRSDPGSRERQLEKKREATASLRSYGESREGGTEEVGEADLLGHEEGAEGFKKRKREMERKKNERETRKEEQLRARAAEREERLATHRKKEESTMDMLKALAKKRFG